ncbi:hypothetical protein ABTY61_14315 [Kitasatospora sp. NPDC096128]|uniref:hypothetical protein n=1 Tax=Kitasatospora sp. NPDC096128 TaxID=3155547 RepID=UPI00331E216B
MPEPTDQARAVVVLNPGDHARATRRLHALPGPGRIVVHPTPGGSAADLARNVLAALGKNPDHVDQDKLTALAAMRHAGAHASAAGVRDLVVDRGHRMPATLLRALAELTQRAGATLWLVHAPDTGAKSVVTPHEVLTGAGLPVTVATFTEFTEQLPVPTVPDQRTNPDVGAPWPVTDWPELPLADFPQFLTVCRRRLPGDLFQALRFLLDQEITTTRSWAGTQRRRGGFTHDRLLAYLRDQRLGPAPSGPVALIRLRAIQIALLTQGHYLRWNPAELGPDPAARLTGVITAKVGAAIASVTDTAASSATALALHLGTSTHGFGLIRLTHLAADGSRLYLPPPADPEAGILAPWEKEGPFSLYDPPDRLYPRDFPHLFTPDPIRLPEPVHRVLAAHRSYRQADGAGEDDPLFLHPTRPGDHNPERGLREAVLRTCHRLHLAPAWLHRTHCRHGDGLLPSHTRAFTWMEDRGLSHHVLAAQRPNPTEAP